MGEYTFKRGKIRGAETWTLSDTTLSRDSESIELADISKVMFEQASAGRQWVTVLKLAVGDKTHTLQCTDAFAGQSRHQFMALCADTASKLNTAGSPATVRQGKGNAALGWFFAAMGVVLFGLGLYWFISMALDDGGLGAALALGGIMMALGAFCIWVGSPWKKPPEQDLAALHQQLINIRAAMGAR